MHARSQNFQTPKFVTCRDYQGFKTVCGEHCCWHVGNPSAHLSLRGFASACKTKNCLQCRNLLANFCHIVRLTLVPTVLRKKETLGHKRRTYRILPFK